MKLRTITSVEQQISSRIKLHIRDHASNKFQEDQQGEMGLDFVSCLNHGIRHTFQDGSVSARVDGWHRYIFQEWELLHCQGFIQVLSLYIFSDGIVAHRCTIFFGRTEKHPGCMVVFIINDIHFVITEILLVFLLQLSIATFEDYDIVIFLLFNNLFFNFCLNFFLLQIFVEPSFAEVALEQEVLLVLRQIFRVIVGIERGFPLPVLTNFDEMITCQFELIRGKFSILLEHIFLRRRTQFLAYFLRSVVDKIDCFIPVIHPCCYIIVISSF